jgi:nitrite reductase (NADH) small subunit
VEVVTMAEIYVGRGSDFDEDRRRVATVDGREVVVFRNGDTYHALANTCLHMGGPVGEGILIGRVEAVVSNGDVVRECFSEETTHLVCPWHGWEYDIETGEAAGDRRLRLPRYDVVEREGEVYVRS